MSTAELVHDADVDAAALEAEAPRSFVADDEPMTDDTYTIGVRRPVAQYVLELVRQRQAS